VVRSADRMVQIGWWHVTNRLEGIRFAEHVKQSRTSSEEARSAVSKDGSGSVSRKLGHNAEADDKHIPLLYISCFRLERTTLKTRMDTPVYL